MNSALRKVTNSSTSCLVALPKVFRLSIKGKFDVWGPFGEKLIFSIVAWSTFCNATVSPAISYLCTFGPAQSCNFKKLKVYETKLYMYIQQTFCLFYHFKLNATETSEFINSKLLKQPKSTILFHKKKLLQDFFIRILAGSAVFPTGAFVSFHLQIR